MECFYSNRVYLVRAIFTAASNCLKVNAVPRLEIIMSGFRIFDCFYDKKHAEWIGETENLSISTIASNEWPLMIQMSRRNTPGSVFWFSFTQFEHFRIRGNQNQNCTQKIVLTIPKCKVSRLAILLLWPQQSLFHWRFFYRGDSFQLHTPL